MKVLRSIAMLAQCPLTGGQAEVGSIRNAALVWDGERIEWVGADRELPQQYHSAESFDAQGALVVPGLIDCHTHLAFGGWRADEFEMRVLGRSYLEIAKAGGGILSTVRATRETQEDALVEKCHHALKEIARLGVTTIECKSGYGLDVENELKLLRAYKRVASEQPVQIVSTFLGAHMVPPEHKETRDEYLDLLCENLIPAVASEGLAEFCDVFVEETAFSIEEARRVFEAGLAAGLRPKLHADQLSDGGGAELAASVGAISADHLECISERGIQQMAERDVVAVMLPLASLYTRQAPLNARKLVDAGVSVAVATDFNPGSAPSFHLPLAMMLGCNMNHLSPAEVLKGVTIYAAKALGLQDKLGSLEAGKRADFAVIDAPSFNHWMYHFQANLCRATVKSGQCIGGAL